MDREDLAEFVRGLRAAGVELSYEAGRLRYRAPKGVLSSESLARIRASKDQIVAVLRSPNQLTAVVEPRIERMGGEDDFPLSFVQEWFFEEYGRLSLPALQHLSCAFRLRGHLDVKALDHTMSELLRRHSALRTRFARLGAEPRAAVDRSTEFLIDFLDLSSVAPALRESRARDRYCGAFGEPFRLEGGRPLRVGLIKYDDEEHVFFIVLHHIVGDAWSLRLLLRDVVTFYGAALEGRAAPLRPIPVRFCDIARRERKVDATLREALLEHWRERFDGLGQDPFFLPADPHPARDRPDCARRLFAGSVSSNTVRRLQAVARNTQSTLFCAVVAVVRLLLKQWTGRDDGLIVALKDGRDRDEVHEVIGCCVTNWGLRVRIDEGEAFEALVSRIWQTYCEDVPFMQLPYYRLVKYLGPDGQPTPPPHIVVNYWAADAPASPVRVDDVASGTFQSAELLEWTPAHPWIDERGVRFYVTFLQRSDSLDWFIRFSGGLFSDSTIENVSQSLCRLLERAGVRPESEVGALVNPVEG